MTNGKASLKQQLMISWKLISILFSNAKSAIATQRHRPSKFKSKNPKHEYPEDNRSGNTTPNCQMRQRLSSHFLRIFPSVFSSPRTITVTAEPTSCTFYFPVACNLQIFPVSRKYHPCHANILANISAMSCHVNNTAEMLPAGVRCPN